MVQLPVLPLATGLAEWTYGVYCDEFAEFQLKDVPVRQALTGFLPSNGVGTGFDRSALESALKTTAVFSIRLPHGRLRNRVADVLCRLPADFIPVRLEKSGPVATCEYFPRRRRPAIRQRSRWVAGIALQGWERHGWNRPRHQWYWFWRDRKGLAANLLSPFANLLFVFWIGDLLAGYGLRPAWLVFHVPAWLTDVFLISTAISAFEAGLRVHLSARIYSAGFAAAGPLRILWANLINFLATLEAFELFVKARIERRTPAWRKTEHVYPRETDLECAFESGSSYSAAAGD